MKNNHSKKSIKTVEIPIQGMTCVDCSFDIEAAIKKVPGVQTVEVLVNSEKAHVQFDPTKASIEDIHSAIENAGYCTPLSLQPTVQPKNPSDTQIPLGNFTNRILILFGIVFGVVLLVVVMGEVLGIFDRYTEQIPWFVWLILVIISGYSIFRGVIQATLRKQITSHTLMTVGLIAAAVVGEWTTALLIVFFMRVAEYVEKFTTERARQALKNLTRLAPLTARIEKNGEEQEVMIGAVQKDDIVIVRPGERIPVDGVVIDGQATVNQAAITGESMPAEVGVGAKVYAATIAQFGTLRIRTTLIGEDTTFGKVIKLVEEAETHRADVQRVADKFSAYYLPVVVVVATLTFVFSHNPLATAAVLVVACSCSFAMATPIAVLASVGAAAKRGLLVKGGKYLEELSRIDVLLIDKTGTLTLGRPTILDVVSLGKMTESEIVKLAASAERYSEHPLAEAVRTLAHNRNITLSQPSEFVAIPGKGIRTKISDKSIAVGSKRLFTDSMLNDKKIHEIISKLEIQGKTCLIVSQDDTIVGILAASDTTRTEVPKAIDDLRALGIKKIELLTGDNERVAASLANTLKVDYQAGLLPEDKIRIVKEYQKKGHTVAMIGDGVNDAPALAQANVGIAMGAAGTDVAIEAAHIALMRDDWALIPEVIHISRRTMSVVKFNIGFTVVYNFIGLALASTGILPPVFAAAAQTLPDLIILGNSSRLLKRSVFTKNIPINKVKFTNRNEKGAECDPNTCACGSVSIDQVHS